MHSRIMEQPLSLCFTLIYQGATRTVELRATRFALGRPGETDTPDLDLSPDRAVSRQHAVIEVREGVCWLKDLGSQTGTKVNGRDIRNQGEQPVRPGDSILIGQTTLRVETRTDGKTIGAGEASTPSVSSSPAAEADGTAQVLRTIETDREMTLTPDTATVAERRLALLLDLPRQFGAQTSRSELLQMVMNQVVQVIPAARRGALLMSDPQHDSRFLLRAYVSEDQPVVSETLARRALTERRGFIWRVGPGSDTSQSILEMKIVTGMFAPIQWRGRVFGVICVDSPVVTDTFAETDLQFLIALGQIAGMSLAEQQTQTELQRDQQTIRRMLANFSPTIRNVLLEEARLGKLRPGGTKSLVTILFCDICNFTRLASQMDAGDVVDMLNHYFEALTDVILRHDGTVDKFVGDAVLAVFGSPQADPQQHHKAVRAALAMKEAVEETNRLRASRKDITCTVRLSVHCGEVFHGFIGTSERLEFTVIGDAVNRAWRYCEAAGEGEILISQDIFQRVYSQVKADRTMVQTKEGELVAYRLKASRGS